MLTPYKTTTRSYYNLLLDGRKTDKVYESMEKSVNAAKRILMAGFSVEIHKTVSTESESHIYEIDADNGDYLRMVQ